MHEPGDGPVWLRLVGWKSQVKNQMALQLRTRDLAHARPRFGYLRIWDLLRREGWAVNQKRIRRWYRLEGLQLRMRVRDECFNVHQFASLAQAQAVIEVWRCDYNQQRPHSSLGHLTPSEFASQR